MNGRFPFYFLYESQKYVRRPSVPRSVIGSVLDENLEVAWVSGQQDAVPPCAVSKEREMVACRELE